MDSHYLAHSNLGVVYAYMGDCNESIYHFKLAQSRNPASFFVSLNLARAYLQCGQNDLAISEYGRILNLHPGYELGYIELAAIYVSMGRHFEALNVLKAKNANVNPLNS